MATAAGSGSNANPAPGGAAARLPVVTGRSRHVLSVLVQNQPGVLAQISGMFASRGFNIDSLAVGETESPQLSRITVVVKGDERHLEQVRKQLEKMIPVVKVQDISREDYVERDLMLLKLRAKAGDRPEVQTLAQIFRARIVDVSPDHLMIEISGKERKIEAFIEAVRGYGILELARTGGIALVRGMGHLEDAPEAPAPPADDEDEASVQGHSEL
ncbi:Putative acetolactate synthase small subunit [Aquisphaera giovannonii]|uniref:acetolactate synthase n=1 Tax=Aquisphaera giovannonii TaxID=406548 RepID=A0A5B9W737_9BACT|nr:acetolactate synthase small subunit [Aquisphaera giovannonii]QEH36373.1 Putative acetolactate synthase small subunit [Aquisphaera giovannonii]